MKRKYIAVFLCICLLLCNTGMIPAKHVKASKIQLTSRAVTIIKGQYAFIGIKGADSKVKWSVTGDNIKIYETDKNSGNTYPYCYIKAVKPGTGILKCKVNKKILKCRTRVLAKSAFIGDFSGNAGEIHLDIFKSGKKYIAFYGEFCLAELDLLEGTVKNGILTLKGEDPAGYPVIVTLSHKGSKWILNYKKVLWNYAALKYELDGSPIKTIILKKCSGKDGFEQSLQGLELFYRYYF